MFADLERSVCFIHVPRTGGTALTLWYAKYVAGLSSIVCLGAKKHLTYTETVALCGDSFEHVFCIYRPFAAIVQSFYHLIEKDYKVRTVLIEPWRSTVIKCYQIKDPYQRWLAAWPQCKDAESTYFHFMAGAPESAKAVVFDELPHSWPKVCKLFGFPNGGKLERIWSRHA